MSRVLMFVLGLFAIGAVAWAVWWRRRLVAAVPVVWERTGEDFVG